MIGRVVLVSDDSDFFEYILPKINLRKEDELYRFCFDELPEKLDTLYNSLWIINSEKSQDKCLELLELLKGPPTLVFGYNEDEQYKVECLKSGGFSYLSYFTSPEEFDAIVTSAFNQLSVMNKQEQYRKILVEHNLITQNNEVFLDYNKILDNELGNSSILLAISPNDKTKFLLKANQIETFILSCVRKSDILMNFAPNKYFLLLKNITFNDAQKIWEKIQSLIPEKIYAGFATVGNKRREQLVNEVLNKLHEAINRDYMQNKSESSDISKNYKIFRKEFNAKMEKIITPVFYHAVQKYGNKFFGMNVSHKITDGCGEMYIKGRYMSGVLRITAPGGSKINIDVTLLKDKKSPETKRITFEPEELDAGVLEDLLEQFIVEFKEEVDNEYT